MLKKIYEQLNQNLMSSRPDLNFSPKVLDSLDEAHRKEIETKIAKLYLSGVMPAIHYFPFFHHLEGGALLKSMSIQNLSGQSLLEYYQALYLCTRESEYLELLLKEAKEDPNAYRCLINIYNQLKDAQLKAQIDAIYQSTHDIDYKFLYENMLDTGNMEEAIYKIKKKEEDKQRDSQFSFQAGELNMLDKDGKAIPLEKQQLIVKLKRELYLREHPEEENSESKKAL